ncbi:hypothetical protein JTE90_019657 [Oedothorax gibbosus]|uniref:Uncharacterized protein n=1 Tax=Oedothorax gibbosus TaxID=931172 RepID=A0AAV6TZY0_9ARAC|nr:hypothetical protein JTE90_019657 [Oedothorax gibbosus]
MVRRKGNEFLGGFGEDLSWQKELKPLLLSTAILSQKSAGGQSSIEARIRQILDDVKLLNKDNLDDHENEMRLAFQIDKRIWIQL